MNASTRPSREDGSTVVELLVAATLTIAAVAMLAGDVLPALRILEDTATPDVRRIELTTAGEVVARAVRAARPDVTRPAVEGDEHRLTIALGPHGTLEVLLDDGRLVLSGTGEHTGAAPFPTGVLVDGLDTERSRLALVDHDGVEVEGDGVAAVVLTLADADADGDVEVVRVVALRMRTHLDGATSW